MDIFSHLNARINLAEYEETQAFEAYNQAATLHWDAYINFPEDREYAERVERRALARAEQYTRRTKALESLKIIFAVKDVDIDTLQAEFKAILDQVNASEDRSQFNDAFALWAMSIDENFSFNGWDDKQGTQGEYPKFAVTFPAHRYTDEIVQHISIMARAVSRPYDYMVDFETSKEGIKKRIPWILTLTGDYKQHAALNLNYRNQRHKKPQPFGAIEEAVANASYHYSDN